MRLFRTATAATTFWLLVAVTASVVVTSDAANAQNSALALTATERRGVDSVFRDLDRTDMPGCAVGVSRQGKQVYVRGYGMSDLQHRIAIGPHSIFHVASVSKQFTAIAVALLAEEGKLSLDDNIRRHIPELPVYSTPITVRQLMHHTSGLRDQWSLLRYAGWRQDDVITEEDVLAIVKRQRGLNFTPGDEYVYSNSGFTLLAIIVKRVSGQTLREFAEARFFAPLGMRDTHFHDDHTMIVPGRTSAYQPRPGGEWRISIPVFDTYGATSLFTTAGDVLNWVAHLDAPTIGSPALWQAAMTSGVLNNGKPTEYGFGLSISTWRGQQVIGHGGSDAGYRANVEFLPEHGLGIAVLCNAATANPGGRSRSVAEVLLAGRLPQPPATARVAPYVASRAAVERWEGTYRDTVSHGVMRITRRGDTLRLGNQVLALASDTTVIQGSARLMLRSGENMQAAITVEPSGLRQVTWLRQRAADTSATALRAFVGQYSSEELDVRWEIVARDSGLVMRMHRLPDALLQTAGRDVFSFGGTTVLFARDRRGRVTGFSVNDSRVRGVRFERLP